MASPKRAWFSISRSSRSRLRPARSSISGRQSSTSFRAAGGGASPGEPLAHHHGDRFLDRRVGAVADLVELAAVEAVVEHGREVLGDAAHASGTDRLDARLLHRLEHRPRLLAAGNELAVHGRIMTGELERDCIGVAAHDGGVPPAELARRLRQARLAADDAGPLGRERDFELGLLGDRAQASRHRALEWLGRAFLAGAFAFEVRGHRC